MSCNYPMWRLDYKKYASLGFRALNISEARCHNGGIILQRPDYDFLSQRYPTLSDALQQIPCGKCLGCRIEYSRQWANRCMHESLLHTSSIFVTLTYDNLYLKHHPYVDVETGEIEMRPMLQPDDLTKFMKDLRRYFEYHHGHTGIRFFACGEYGDKNGRPHFHLILFNLDFDDKKLWFSRDYGDSTCNHYISPTLDKIWDKGIATISELNWNSAAYTARYIMKKQKGKSAADQRDVQRRVLLPFECSSEDEFKTRLGSTSDSVDWQHEFVRCSRRPGIAHEYYDRHRDEIYMTDEMFVPMKDGVRSFKPAKYYDYLYDIDFPDEMHEIKLRREYRAKMAQLQRKNATDLTEVEYLEAKEERIQAQIKLLPRTV